jgi:hypothetical protein
MKPARHIIIAFRVPEDDKQILDKLLEVRGEKTMSLMLHSLVMSHEAVRAIMPQGDQA